MALIKCSECGHDVSNRAENCPECGAPVGPAFGKRAPHSPSAMGCGCLLVLLFIVYISQMGNDSKKKEPGPSPLLAQSGIVSRPAVQDRKPITDDDVRKTKALLGPAGEKISDRDMKDALNHMEKVIEAAGTEEGKLPKSEPQEPLVEKRWRLLGTWEGYGDRNTQLFKISSEQCYAWWIAYQRADADTDYVSFSLNVWPKDSNLHSFQPVTFSTKSGEGDSLVHLYPGTYYLQVQSNCNWTVQFKELCRDHQPGAGGTFERR